MLNLRSINDGIDRKREELLDDYLDTKYSQFTMRSIEDYEQLKKVCSVIIVIHFSANFADLRKLLKLVLMRWLKSTTGY